MRQFTLLALFLTTSALACPDLSGTYPVCSSAAGDVNENVSMSISQSVINGVTVYSFTATDSETNQSGTDTLTANNIPTVLTSEDPETGMKVSTTSTVYCDNSKSLNEDVTLSVEDEVVIRFQTKVTKNNQSLIIENRVHNEEGDDSQTVICK